MGDLRAFVHVLSPRMNEALRPHAAYQAIDLARAREQHAGYVAMLEGCGVTVEALEVNAAHPDAVFIEDCAIVLDDDLAIVGSMGAPSRAAEPLGIEPALRRFRPEVARVLAPATLEGGDVLR